MKCIQQRDTVTHIHKLNVVKLVKTHQNGVIVHLLPCTVRSCHQMNCTQLPPHELYASATRCTVHSCYHMCCAHLQPHVLCTHLLPGVYTIQYTLCYHMCCAHLHHMNCVRSNYPCTYCILYAAGTTCTVHICNQVFWTQLLPNVQYCSHYQMYYAQLLPHVPCAAAYIWPCALHISVTFATTCTVRSYYHMYCAAVTTCTAPRVYTLSTPIGLKQNGDRKGCWLTASWQLVDSWWKCWRSFPLAEVTAIPL